MFVGVGKGEDKVVVVVPFTFFVIFFLFLVRWWRGCSRIFGLLWRNW